MPPAIAAGAPRRSRGSPAAVPSRRPRPVVPCELEPMSAVERRIVHEALKDDPEVATASEGAEPNRYVVVLPQRSAD